MFKYNLEDGRKTQASVRNKYDICNNSEWKKKEFLNILSK